jgi:hypothetical protein
MKLIPLLAMLEGLAMSELLDEFGCSSETAEKLKAAFDRVRRKAPDYIAAVFDGDEPDSSGVRALEGK